MAKTGPIIIIEDDTEDRHLMELALNELHLPQERRFFDSAQEVLYYLMDTQEKPFLILSDVDLPGMSGIELRRKINESFFLSRKSIPFIFFSNSARSEDVDDAYKTMVQGYFVKPFHLEELKEKLRIIFDYWSTTEHPHSI
ncbi:response regulator [Flaviaesturariibacter amylovorans]|uniref:Chemotaxis response regulator CheY n=1 Tax=Flaviaesturariibacter amylovorans TaxID=1084520 RepID=A0ABP8GZB6_9BACT